MCPKSDADRVISEYIWIKNGTYYCNCPECTEIVELAINDEEDEQAGFYGECDSCEADIDFFYTPHEFPSWCA